ncbi:MAG TPA: hypothetical protein VF910_07945, partial [Candidatus Bathyarchaeia archaeon]
EVGTLRSGLLRQISLIGWYCLIRNSRLRFREYLAEAVLCTPARPRLYHFLKRITIFSTTSDFKE